LEIVDGDLKPGGLVREASLVLWFMADEGTMIRRKHFMKI